MRFSKILIIAIALKSLGVISVARAQESSVTPQANPVPQSIRPNYNYSETFSYTACHFVMGAGGDHNLEAVGVKIRRQRQTISFHRWRLAELQAFREQPR